MKRENFNTGLLLVIAVSVGAVSSGALLSGPGISATPATGSIENWQDFQGPSLTLMEGDGTITIIEFSDFQCPYCASASATLDALAKRYPGQVTVKYRHLPLPSHPHAVAAAEAAECANEQGAFAHYHDMLFAQRDSIGVKPWEAFAQEAGVPELSVFRECVDSRRYSERVESDIAAAAELGFRATPTFIVNGGIIRGAQAVPAFERLIQ